jgi:hypothetical protein
MPKFKVTVYHETYTDYIVTADDVESAQDLVMQGEYDNVDDVTVKDSDIINTTEIKDE